MTELITRKKNEKRRRLLDAAYELFIAKGVSDTSIAQICTRAEIAKGTFYLYFKDKDDILRSLIKKISSTILEDSYRMIDGTESFVEGAIKMADYLMNLFASDPETVRIMRKDFVWPISEEEFLTTENETMRALRIQIEKQAVAIGITEHQMLVRLYAMISMICSISYSSIMDNFPSDIDTLKPEVFDMIRATFSK